MSTSKRYMDYVDENLIYDDDCASLPNYIMCARQSVLLATTAESAFFFVWSFLSALPCCCTQSSASSSACLCGAHSWVFFLCFHWRFARFVLRKVCFLSVLERSTAFWGGTAGVKKARNEQRKAGFRFVS